MRSATLPRVVRVTIFSLPRPQRRVRIPRRSAVADRLVLQVVRVTPERAHRWPIGTAVSVERCATDVAAATAAEVRPRARATRDVTPAVVVIRTAVAPDALGVGRAAASVGACVAAVAPIGRLTFVLAGHFLPAVVGGRATRLAGTSRRGRLRYTRTNRGRARAYVRCRARAATRE